MLLLAKFRASFLPLLAVLSFACGDAGSSGTGGGGGADASGSGAGGAEDDGPPKAPYLDTVAALHGALHLFWTNETTNCDAIEIERSIDEEPFGLIFSVEADVEDLADDSATDPTLLYAYRLRCKKGDAYSPYSNVDSRSPKPPEEEP